MKCPVPYCNAELKVNIEEIDSPDTGEPHVNYSPYCDSCGFLTNAVFSTPELAIEAMRPKVSEELVNKVLEMCAASHYRGLHKKALGNIT